MNTAHLKALAIVPKLAGFTSFCFSSLIVFTVVRDKRKRTSPYHRLLCGISIVDMSSSFWLGLSTWPIPEETGIMYAVGNDTTCRLQGFWTQAGIASSLYNVSLSIYYVLVIRRGWKQSALAKVELYFHAIPLVWGLGTAAICLAQDVLGNANLWCWILPSAPTYRWTLFYGPLWCMIALVTINCIIVWLHVFRVEQKSLRYSIHHQERAHHYNEQTQRARDRLRRRNDSSQMQDASISDIPVNTCEEIQLPLNAQKQSESITAEAVSAASELPAVSMDLRNNGTTSSMETIRLGKDENYYRHNDDRLHGSNDTKDTIEYTTESEDKVSIIKAPPSVEEHEIVFGSHSDELGADDSTDLLDAPFVFKAMDNENDQNNTFHSLSADPKDAAEMPAIDLHEGQIAEASTMGSTLLHANLETKHHTDQDGHNDGAGKNPLAGADKQMNGSMNHSARQTDEIDSIHEIAEKSDSSDDPGKVNEERPRPIGSFSSHEPERAEAHVESQSNEIIQSATLEGTSAAISETTYSSVSWSLPPRKRPNGLSANGFPNSSNERRMSLDQQSSRSRMASLFRSFRKQERMQMKLKRTKQVAKLCFRYAVAFYINWVALTTIRVCQIFDPSFSSFGLFLVAGFTTPIQGLPNFIIYLGPLIWEETRKHFERQKQQQENARVLSATPQSEVSIIWQQAGTGIHRIGQISSALIQGVRSALVRSAESEAEFLSHSQEISGSTLSATRDKTSTDNILDPFASLEDWNESEDEDDIDIEEKETVGYGLSRQPSDDESVQS